MTPKRTSGLGKSLPLTAEALEELKPPYPNDKMQVVSKTAKDDDKEAATLVLHRDSVQRKTFEQCHTGNNASAY